MKFRSWLSSLVSAVLGLSALAFAPGVHAQQAVDPDAQIVLAAMSNHLGSLKSFEVEYAAADEIVTPEGQKLQFLHSGEVTLKRPDKLHVIRRVPRALEKYSWTARSSPFSARPWMCMCSSTCPA